MLRSCLLLHLISLASAASFYVSLTGSDANAGTTPALPFKTIAACAAAMSKEQSDSECSVEAGVYRESVTLKHSNNNPHRQMFRSVPGNGTSKAIISGLEEIHGLWTRRRKTERHRTTLPPPPPSCIWQIPMTDAPVDGGRIDQLFVQVRTVTSDTSTRGTRNGCAPTLHDKNSTHTISAHSRSHSAYGMNAYVCHYDDACSKRVGWCMKRGGQTLATPVSMQTLKCCYQPNTGR